MGKTQKCKHCQAEIDKKAKACPSCGKKQGGNAKFFIIGIIALFILIGALNTEDDKNTKDTANEAANTQIDSNKESTSTKNKGSEKVEVETTPEPTIEPTEEPTPEPTEEATTTYESGMYKIGSDMPAGEYVIFADNILDGYMEISSSSNGTLDDIIANANFTYNTIITVNDGNYLTLVGAYAVPFDEVNELDTTGEGMFKVGVHIKAGEYKVKSTNDLFAYIEVSNDSSHNLDSIVTNDNFESEKYITVEDGQYLTITGGKLIQ